ncbi:MAG: DEAD/DEAH box helicase, partial [Deinococcus-Thermus bacterium]|nr:DEAD/DEAH box helicase [Deinococcota bacterium]
MKFSDLGLKPEILRAVEDAGYETPTPIQAQAIPVVLEKRDVLGIAQTGTGKTAGFTLPMIQHLAKGRARARMPRSLILEPTRELASQVAENFDKYTKYENLNYALLIGGERFDEQVKRLDRGVDVLIATPGRMIDLFERGKVLLADVKILVIDEADRMLDMGFIPDIERIVGLLPRKRQTLFFSATMPKEIRRLADAFLDNPEEIAVSKPATTAEGVEQRLVPVAKADKREALRDLLRGEELKNALVFCNRKRDVTVVYNSLKKHGFSTGQLHGDMSQPARTETLERFKQGDIQILVCSDVAARGIDISELSHVINFDVPIHADDYVHRIGRTGRAGRKGRAFTFATPEEGKYVAAIEERVGAKIPRLAVEGVEPVEVVAEDKPKRGRRRRPSGKTEAPALEVVDTGPEPDGDSPA